MTDQIYDPQTGERITFLDGQRGPDQSLRLEFVLDPGGLVPGLHVHPHQEERFRLVEGAFFKTLFAWINHGKVRSGIGRLLGCRATPPDRTRAR